MNLFIMVPNLYIVGSQPIYSGPEYTCFVTQVTYRDMDNDGFSTEVREVGNFCTWFSGIDSASSWKKEKEEQWQHADILLFFWWWWVKFIGFIILIYLFYSFLYHPSSKLRAISMLLCPLLYLQQSSDLDHSE